MENPLPPTASSMAVAADFEDLLVSGATLLLAVAGSWLAVVALAGAAESLSGGRVRALALVRCPTAWRPVVLLLVGAALALPTTVAHAVESPEDAGGGHRLPLPTRPVDPPARQLDLQVVVRPYDTLWGIARQHLAASADDASVMGYATRLHRANQVLIGDDPDLIHPGQRLALPAAPRERVRR